MGVGVLILLVAYGGFVFAARANRGIEADVDRSYVRLTNWAGWLGLTVRPADTPYERAEALAATVPEGRKSIFALTQQYVISKFSRSQDNPFFNPLPEWAALRPLLLREAYNRRLAGLKARLARPFRRGG